MFKTRNDIPLNARIQIIALLQERIACSLDLMTQAKQAHWMVKGPNFKPLHDLFDDIAGAATGYTDSLAERVMQLGGTIAGTLRASASKTSLPEYPLDIYKGKDHVTAMSLALATYGASIRRAIDQVLALNDQATASILINIVDGVDKLLWFTEANGQADS